MEGWGSFENSMRNLLERMWWDGRWRGDDLRIVCGKSGRGLGWAGCFENSMRNFLKRMRAGGGR